jgi:hypothetical protein
MHPINDLIFRVKHLQPLTFDFCDDPKDGGLYFDFNNHGIMYRVIASWGGGWDHVSVSSRRRLPTWSDMTIMYRLFFKDDEYAMQLHCPPDAHINCHPYCLHLWRPQNEAIPTPPQKMV